jgi:alpha-tubulin suppressor-like RCC1 family protein
MIYIYIYIYHISGDGRNETSPTPIKLKFIIIDENGKKVNKGIIKSISAGFSHSAALGINGEFYVWGKGMSDKIRLNNDIKDVEKEVSKGVILFIYYYFPYYIYI